MKKLLALAALGLMLAACAGTTAQVGDTSGSVATTQADTKAPAADGKGSVADTTGTAGGEVVSETSIAGGKDAAGEPPAHDMTASASGVKQAEAGMSASAGASKTGATDAGALNDAITKAAASTGTKVAGAETSDVFFDFDRYNVRDEYVPVLQAVAAWQASSGKGIIVEGHCDDRGTREYNLALGDRRANEVRKFLVFRGVPEHRIETISYGEENPVCMDQAEECWQRNRRGHMREAQ